MANVITGIRIVCSLALVFSPTFSQLFYVFYIIGGLSDILDGLTARYFGKETEFGAKFDTVADILFTAVVLIKVLNKVHVVGWLIIWVVFIAVIKCFNIVSGFAIAGHFVSEHTVLNKACGVLMFVIPFCIGLFSQITVFISAVITCVIATVASVQEGYLIRTGKIIDLTVSTGDVDVQSVVCDESIDVVVKTCETELENVRCNSLVSSGSTGDILLENVIAEDKIGIDRSTGDVSDTTSGGKCKISSDTGDVKISIEK